jgi:hypothetical protein
MFVSLANAERALKAVDIAREALSRVSRSEPAPLGKPVPIESLLDEEDYAVIAEEDATPRCVNYEYVPGCDCRHCRGACLCRKI